TFCYQSFLKSFKLLSAYTACAQAFGSQCTSCVASGCQQCASGTFITTGGFCKGDHWPSLFFLSFSDFCLQVVRPPTATRVSPATRQPANSARKIISSVDNPAKVK